MAKARGLVSWLLSCVSQNLRVYLGKTPAARQTARVEFSGSPAVSSPIPADWHPCSPAVDPLNLRGFLAHHQVVVLHFWAIWNLHDRAYDRQMQPIREEFADRIAFGSIDADNPQYGDIAKEYQFRNLPALACFVRGKWVETLIGSRPAEELRARMLGWLDIEEAPEKRGHRYP